MRVGQFTGAELLSQYRTQRDELLSSARSGKMVGLDSKLQSLGENLRAESTRDTQAAMALDDQFDSVRGDGPYAQSVRQRFDAASKDYAINSDLRSAFDRLSTQVGIISGGPGEANTAQRALHDLAVNPNVVGMHFQAGTLTVSTTEIDANQKAALETWFSANAALLSAAKQSVKIFELQLAQ